MKPLLIKSLESESIPHFPVWLMRQAGRYLPEYRELKTRHTFLEMCKTPEIATEVTLQPLRRFAVDAAIIFADILLPAELAGFQLDFDPGPKIANQIKSPEDISKLRRGDPRSDLHYVYSALQNVRAKLDEFDYGAGRPALLGFAGAPWTMSCYLTHQGPLKEFMGTLAFAYRNRTAFHDLLNLLADITSEYLIAQLEAGADAVQLFDSWGGLLDAETYNEFSLPYIQRIVGSVKRAGGKILVFLNNGGHLLHLIDEFGADGVSVDWRTPLRTIHSGINPKLALQGNLPPTKLFLPLTELRAETQAMLQNLPRKTAFIANLGHGVLQGTPVEAVKMFVDTVHEYRLDGA